jgi:uncharacterized membrane protein YdbT with pleckstrin-like domain
MPPRQRRASLESVKARLVTEQKARTERRVRQLLQQDTEVSDDSEEENRLTARQTATSRQRIEQGTQTESVSSWSFCCGVFVGVLAIVGVLSFGLVASYNDRQRMAK